MIKLLSFVVVLLTAITGLGIVGLASFNVSRRTRQIGIRRALGATRASVMRHFMIENFLVSTVGVAVGAQISVDQPLLNKVLPWYKVPPREPCFSIRVGDDIDLGPYRTAPPPLTARRLNARLVEAYEQELAGLRGYNESLDA